MSSGRSERGSITSASMPSRASSCAASNRPSRHDPGSDDRQIAAGATDLRFVERHGVEAFRHRTLGLVEQLVLENQHGIRAVIGVGAQLQGFLASSGSHVWRVAAVSYIGTLLTKQRAGRQRLLVSYFPPHRLTPSGLGSRWRHLRAGSSSSTTAASAGILLVRETKYLPPEDRITFGTYLWFGLAASLVMLAYYIVVLTIWKF